MSARTQDSCGCQQEHETVVDASLNVSNGNTILEGMVEVRRRSRDNLMIVSRIVDGVSWIV